MHHFIKTDFVLDLHLLVRIFLFHYYLDLYFGAGYTVLFKTFIPVLVTLIVFLMQILLFVKIARVLAFK
jgi:hypothetical protein